MRVTQIPTPGCPARVGTQVFDSIDVAQLGGSVAMTATHGSPVDESCRYSGAYVQEGHMGTLGGNYSCSSGASGTFTLQSFECLGACDRAPVVMINNDHWQERLTADRVPQFVDDLRVKGLAALSGCHHVTEART